MCEHCNCGGKIPDEHPLQREEKTFHDEILKCLNVFSGKITECRSHAGRESSEKLLSVFVALKSRVEHLAASISAEISHKYRLGAVKDSDLEKIQGIDQRLKTIIDECGNDISNFSCSGSANFASFNEKVNAHIREFEHLYAERAKILRLYRIYG